jgi:hypothetical protein
MRRSFGGNLVVIGEFLVGDAVLCTVFMIGCVATDSVFLLELLMTAKLDGRSFSSPGNGHKHKA